MRRIAALLAGLAAGDLPASPPLTSPLPELAVSGAAPWKFWIIGVCAAIFVVLVYVWSVSKLRGKP